MSESLNMCFYTLYHRFPAWESCKINMWGCDMINKMLHKWCLFFKSLLFTVKHWMVLPPRTSKNDIILKQSKKGTSLCGWTTGNLSTLKGHKPKKIFLFLCFISLFLLWATFLKYSKLKWTEVKYNSQTSHQVTSAAYRKSAEQKQHLNNPV